jgi:hypothetical protein
MGTMQPAHTGAYHVERGKRSEIMLSVAEQARLVSTGEAARALGIDPSTLARWVAAGYVRPTLRTRGRHMRWDLNDLRQQINERERESEQ